MLSVLVILGIVGAAASSGGKKPASNSTSSTNAGATAITGFGATDTAWNSAHTEDTDFASGAVYNADPSLPKVNGHTGTHYAAVQHENGHVLGYEYRFLDEPIAAAKADVLRTQFPADVKVVWFARKATCAQMMVRSAALGLALSDPAIGDKVGSVLVEFSSGVAEDSYDPSAVNDALFLLLPLESKSKAPGC